MLAITAWAAVQNHVYAISVLKFDKHKIQLVIIGLYCGSILSHTQKI